MNQISTSTRFSSLDIFRGLTVYLMIFVNTPGNEETTFWPLLHANWHGFTLADLVFPSFLFAVGNSLVFSSHKWADLPKKDVIWKILKRSFLIFSIGFLLNWFPFFRINDDMQWTSFPFSETRIMGVLQRIAICYGVVAFLIYFCGRKTTIWVGSLGILLYWAILYLFGTYGEELSKTGNVVLKLDIWLFGAKHLYFGEGFPFDPEGILSTIPTLFNVIGGYIVGFYLLKYENKPAILKKIAIGGTIILLIAFTWNLILPFNKKLWTGSFSLLTTGFDCLLLAGIVYVHDVTGLRKGSNIFIVAGRNPLFIYLLSEISVSLLWTFSIGEESVYSWLFIHLFKWIGDYWGSLLFALSWVMICWRIAFLLDKKRIYIKF